VRDATVPRFNLPAEPARTVGFGNRDLARTVGSETRQRTHERSQKNQATSVRERFDYERERKIGCGIGDGESKDQSKEGPCVYPSVTTGRREK